MTEFGVDHLTISKDGIQADDLALPGNIIGRDIDVVSHAPDLHEVQITIYAKAVEITETAQDGVHLRTEP